MGARLARLEAACLTRTGPWRCSSSAGRPWTSCRSRSSSPSTCRTASRARSVAIAFGGYAAWVIATARIVPYSGSGLLVLLFGLVLDSRRETPPERVWALGALVAAIVFWAIPVAVVWRWGRASRPRTG